MIRAQRRMARSHRRGFDDAPAPPTARERPRRERPWRSILEPRPAMESPGLPTRDPRLSPRGRLWLALGAALLLGLTLLPWILPFGPLRGDVPGTLAAVAVMGVPAVLLAFGARRGDLDPRLRRALGFLAASIGLAVLGNLVRLLSALGVHVPDVPGIGLASNVVIWACGLAALLSIPMRPLGREALWQMGTDTTIAVGGL